VAAEAPPGPAPPAAPPVQQKATEVPVPLVDPASLENAHPAALRMMSSDTARNYHALPIACDEKTITIAFAAPPDAKAVRAIQYATSRLVRVVLAPAAALEQAILRFYPARAPRAMPSYAQAPLVDPRHLQDRDPDLIKLFRVEVARKYRVVPVERMGSRLSVAMENPGDLPSIQDLEFVCGYTVKALRCEPEILERAIERYYPPGADVQADAILAEADASILDSVELMDELRDQVYDLEASLDDRAPAVKLTNMLIKEAVVKGASDLHIETYETDFRVRMRVDGTLCELTRPPRSARDGLLSRIKVMSGMNIAETRMPQDGRVKLRMKTGNRAKPIDLRVSTVPTIWGERLAMRVLDPDRLTLDLTRLGFDRDSLTRFQRNIVKPYGMILVVGPSGCGKTNTLYSAMSAVNNTDVNILTAEDPIEFNIKGINQVQTNEGVGYTFATALRAFLRQDPNIILVGEIRDFETAEIAVKASLTGHLVLSTLHTTDAPTTVSRLINMGIEPYLIATSVLLISAQRLVRRICAECAEPDPRPESELLELGFKSEDFPVIPKRGRGCRTCGNRGIKGRTGVFEVLEFTDAIRELILAGATPMELKLRAREDGMLSLRGSGLRKIKEGIVSVEEIARETML